MALFHVLHWMPDPRVHIFKGYNEIIESVIWGLRALGHDVTFALNAISPGRRLIVFGAHLVHPSILMQLPDRTIIYNLEQLEGLAATGRPMEGFAQMAERFVVWDYSAINVAVWDGRFAARAARHVPVGFAAFQARIGKPAVQDIDALIYGAPSDRRMLVLRGLCDRGLSAMFVCGLYGAARDALIGRAKLVVNVTSNAESTIFSIARVAYLLANRKAVLADLAAAEADMAAAVRFAPLSDLADLCAVYARDDDRRAALEHRGHAAIARRDVRGILADALDFAAVAA